jgi:SOS-response transcriptional repressor LexA
MNDQSTLTDFGNKSDPESDMYECEICERVFDSSKGRGIHRANAHTEEEIRDVLIAELQRLADQINHPPGLRDMNQYGAHSSKTYQKKFGSWNNALRAAGLEINAETNIDKSDLIDELRRLAKELDRTPTSRDMADQGKYGTATYTHKFGSWNDAVQEAGLEVVRRRDVPRHDMISEIQRLADELGEPPAVYQMRDQGKLGVTTISREFGTWNDALEHAGYEPNKEMDVSEEKLTQELTRLHDELGRPPKAEEMSRHGAYSIGTFERRFGSWNAALERAGFDLHNRTNIPRDELLDELTRLSDVLDRTPTSIDMESSGRFAHATYRRAFGSWNDAIREADLTTNVRSDIPEPELLDELKSLRDELGRTPERREMDQQGQFDSSTYSHRFGTWNDALRAANIDPSKRRNIPKSDLKDEIRRLADELNRPPTRDEMEQQGKFSHSVYSHRFGTWTDALIETGLEPHKTLNPDHLDHRVDSVSELKIAELLVDAGVEYENEGMTIQYGDARTYTPDFVTEEYVIEVKGEDWGKIYDKKVTAKQKARAAMDSVDDRAYVVIGEELPADIHINWGERAAVHELFE